MPLSHAWLDDVRPSPYADQLALGFRLLRFSRPLEQEYRNYVRDDTFDLKRIALVVGILVWLAFAAFDFVLILTDALLREAASTKADHIHTCE